jgi:tRNA pseudouridine55 synthase
MRSLSFAARICNSRRSSGKKIDGDRAYDLARRNQPVMLQPADVTAHALDVLEWDGARLRLRLVCSAGFYVRSLAQPSASAWNRHLAGLVRTGAVTSIQSAISMTDLDRRRRWRRRRSSGSSSCFHGCPR